MLWSDVRLDDGLDLKLFILVGWDWSFVVCYLVHRGSSGDSPLLKIFQWCCLTSQGSTSATQYFISVESSSLILRGTL